MPAASEPGAPHIKGVSRLACAESLKRWLGDTKNTLLKRLVPCRYFFAFDDVDLWGFDILWSSNVAIDVSPNENFEDVPIDRNLKIDFVFFFFLAWHLITRNYLGIFGMFQFRNRSFTKGLRKSPFSQWKPQMCGWITICQQFGPESPEQIQDARLRTPPTSRVDFLSEAPALGRGKRLSCSPVRNWGDIE